MVYTLVSNGDVPDEDYFNLALMKQTIVVCTSGTRPSAPVEGMHIYETDTDLMQKYDGSDWKQVASTRQAYSPTLTASTNPTLGSASKATGWYQYMPGPSITFSFFIKFGTSGVGAGSGQYLVTLPVAAADAHNGDQPAMGACMVRDNSVNDIRDGTIYVPGSNLNVVALLVGSTTVSNANPWTWAASDYLAGTITYPI